jgi:outer membrane protein OmpA-like peptidoglycan-associated protein
MSYMLCGLALSLLLLAPAGAAPLDLTGAWSPKMWTARVSLFQEGDHVWGYGGAKDFWLRGHWNEGSLVLVMNRLDLVRKTCEPRGSWLLTGTTLANLASTWVQDGQRPLKGPWTRTSPDPGGKIEYPYAQELESCGSLRTYELSFASGSDKLQGSEWPVLAALAELMKRDVGLKMQISGHTDSSGDAAKNQELSERRAAMVKQIMTGRYGADAGRIDIKGHGPSQPLQENDTPEGRALNRRVEMIRVR